MVGWLNPSTRINGSPLINFLIIDPSSYSEEVSDRSSDEINKKDPAFKSAYPNSKY